MSYERGVQFHSARHFPLKHGGKLWTLFHPGNKSQCPRVPISFRSSYVFIFLSLHITEDVLKYSSAMYHCALFSPNTSYTPSLSLLSVAFSLSVASKMLYNDDDSSRCPGCVFAIKTQSRTAYSSWNRISCLVGTLSRSQKAFRNHQRHLARPPEDAAHSHCCEEVVSFIFSLFLTHVTPESDAWRDVDKKRKKQTRRIKEILEFVSKKTTALLCGDFKWDSEERQQR